MVSEKSLANLRPNKGYTDDMTESEKERIREFTSKGGKATQECLKKAKTFKDVCNQALITKVSKEKAKTFLGDDVDLIVFDDDGYTDMQTVLSIRALRLSADGNCRYMDFIRDTSGQKPRDTLEISADIMTDADRRLLDMVSKRITADDVKSD